jgi:hypothetical protein
MANMEKHCSSEIHLAISTGEIGINGGPFFTKFDRLGNG